MNKPKMKLEPQKAKPVGMVVTDLGVYLNLEEMKARCRDDRVIDTALAMFKIGYERGDGPREAMRRAIGSLLMACAGEDKRP